MKSKGKVMTQIASSRGVILLWALVAQAALAADGVKFLPLESAARAGMACVIQIQVGRTNALAGTADDSSTLAAQLRTFQGVYPVTLQRAESAPGMAPNQPTGEFVIRTYRMNVPPGVTGPAELSLIRNPHVRMALLIDGEDGFRAAGPAGAQSSTNEIVQDAKPTAGDQQAKSGLSHYFLKHILPYEPMYLLWGPDDPGVKIQFSIMYRLFTFPDGPGEVLNGLHLGYTQTSLCDVRAESSPFRDSSYRPELLYVKDWDLPAGRVITHLTLQGGVMHESNGQDWFASRSVNIAYLRPSVRLGPASSWNLQLAPRIWTYLDALSDNPDLKDYRGYGDLRAILAHGNGVVLSANLRMGQDWNHWGTQFDLSYPSNELLPGLNLDLFLHAQYYTGFGESLLDYDRRTDAIRFGISLVR
jgi:outer membrane phospholipase A